MFDRRRGAGAIEDFDRARFGGPTRAKESQATVTAVVAQVLPANPDRVMLIVTNNGPDQITWGLDGTAAVGKRQLIGNGQTEVFQVQNDGELTGRALYMVVPVNNTDVSFLEVIRVHADS